MVDREIKVLYLVAQQQDSWGGHNDVVTIFQLADKDLDAAHLTIENHGTSITNHAHVIE